MRKASLGRRAGHFVVWWLVLFAVWWAFVGEWSVTELYWGVGGAMLAAVAGMLMTAYGLVDGRSIGRSLRIAPSVVKAVGVDFGVIIAVLVRRIAGGQRGVTGAFVRRPSDVGAEGLHDPAVRSWLTIAATFSPNSYVIDLDPDRGEVLLHDLRPLRTSEQPA